MQKQKKKPTHVRKVVRPTVGSKRKFEDAYTSQKMDSLSHERNIYGKLSDYFSFLFSEFLNFFAFIGTVVKVPRDYSLRRYHTKITNELLTPAIVLSVIGIIFIASSLQPTGEIKLAGQQLIYLGISVGLFYWFKNINVQLFFNYRYTLLTVGIVLLLLANFGPFSVEINGASRWIGFNGRGVLQPAEFVRIAYIIFLTYYLANARLKIKNAIHFVNKRVFSWDLIMMLLIPILLLLMMPDLGTTMAFGFTTLAMILATDYEYRVVGNQISVAVVLGVIAGFIGMLVLLVVAEGLGTRIDRIAAYLNPFAHEAGASWQVIQASTAIALGGITGVGIGSSTLKYGFVPEAHTDMIFAIIAEETGLIGITVVFVIYGWLFYLLIRAIVNMKHSENKLIVTGILMLLLINVVLNIGGLSLTIPLSGVPLPFISYGGTALLSNFILLGIAQSAITTDRHEQSLLS